MCFVQGTPETFAKMDPLTELADVLAENDQLADEKIEWIRKQGSFDSTGQCTVSSSQLKCVLALARFLSQCEDPLKRSDLLAVVLELLKAVPFLASKAAFPRWFNFDSASIYFKEVCMYLVKISDSGLADSTSISSIISSIIESLATTQVQTNFPAPRALFYALSRTCPSFHVSHIDQVSSRLLELCLPASTSTPSSRDTSAHGSPFEKKSLIKSMSNGGRSCSQAHTHSPSRESLDLMVLGQAEEQDLKDDSPSSSPSTTPSTMAFSGNIVGRESLEQLTLGRGPNDRAASLHYVLALQEENVDDLQKQETAFRFFVGILERAGSNFLGKDKFLLELRASAGGQLKWVPSILKSRKRDWTIDGSLINTKVNMKLQVCEAASTVYTKCFLLLKAEGKGSKNFLRETLALLLDAADACAVSSWRRLRACECLFDHILQNIAFTATSCRSQVLKVLLLRLKTLVLAICAQADPWSKSQGPLFNSIVKTSCDILTTGWDMDRPVFESFLLALATNARECSEQEEKARRVIATMQLNVIRFLANLVIMMNKLDIAEIIFPLFVESLEEGDASIPSCLRLQLLDAVARIASMGFEKPYRETVVLLTKSYIDKLSTVGSTQSRTLAPEATTERVETLPGAFLTIASRLTQPKLRADYRHRLLQLCSDVGLDAESKSGKNGADLLGPLLPSVAEICADFDFSGVVAPSLLKLFRNLWFYIVLFGLAPPIQKGTTPSKNVSTSNPSGGSMSAVALQAVTGPYLWNTQWSESVTRIAHGTPPLVGSSVKFVEDELELNELHNPGSRRGNNNEKAAVIQRAALSAALRDHVDMVSMNTMSAVKATYFLAVAFLEILRLKYRGGILATDGKEQQKSALRCVFEYLEKPNKVPSVQQCLSAIAYKAFDAAMAWLDERTIIQRVDANEREAVIATHGCFLISMLAHREDGVRELSCRLLNQLKLKYPQVLWNSACLDALFGLVGTQVLPDLDGAKIGGIRSLLQGQIRNWLIQSIALAPCTSQGLLQEQFRMLNSRPKATYVSELLMFLAQIRLDPTQNEGWGNSQVVVIPAVIAAAAAAAGARPEFTQLGNLEVLSNSIVSANIKSNYIHINIGGVTFGQGHLQDSAAGIILGGSRQDSMTEQRSKKLNSAKRVLKERLIASFLHHLQQFVSAVEGGSTIDAEAFRETCFRSTAFIVSELDITEKVEMQGFPQLLRLLCWCPAYICSADAIETGIFVWTWLVSAAPQLSALLLAELVDAWLWTIETGRGIFASGVANSGPAAKLRPHLSPGEPVSSGDRDSVEGITAHRLWLGFFFDRFEVVRHSSTEQLSLIGRLLQGSFKKPDHFSSHPAATGAFFSLLLLGLKFCSCQLHRSPTINVGVFLLEDRLHRAALAWFSVDPGWYDLNVKGFSQSEFQAVAIFAQALGLYYTETLTVGEPTGKLCAQEIEGLTTNSLCTQFDIVHPVWGRGENSLNLKEKRKQLLMMLCLHEADRLETWANPLRDYASSRLRVSSDCWSDYMRTAWSVDPRIAFALAARFPSIGVLKVELTLLVQAHLYDIYYIPEALPYFVTPKAVEENSLNLQCLPHWAPCSITSALEFLTPAYKGHPRVMAYVLRVLETYPPETVTFFMPQLVQTLRYDDGGLVERYLITAAQRSHLFAHILIWQLQGEESPSNEELGKEQLKENTFHDIVLKVKHRIIASFTKEALDMFTREFRFFDKVTDISGALYPLPKEQRRAGIRRELEKIEVEGDDLYLPTAPNKLVRGIQLDSGIPLQSAAKVPIMVTFNVVDRDEPTQTKPQACIFKVGDDCRQDVLALQVISLLKDIFQAVNLNLYLFPYGVLPTGCGKGIIEVVPNTRSRNQMGETTDGGLYEVFQQDYGPVGSPQFEAARDNFIVSSAGYAVASLILQPKDRHNGNLLLDNQGRLVHIDFGFILETSPGGNLRFENAQFKLSHEMTQLLDPSKSMKSETWKYFVSLCVKGYLAARLHMDGIINAVLLMVDSGLPCFSRGDPIGNLRKRFHPEMNEWEAANFMKRTCEDAYNKWTTTGYDLIQYLQQGIEK